MTDALDTGDLIRHRGESLIVACVHDGIVHPCGHPDRWIKTEECLLIRKASADDRLHLLRQMAQVTVSGHRPKCARERLQKEGV